MKKRDPHAPHPPAADLGISRRALAIARLLDRHCRAPGRYTITIEIPAHARAPWSAEITRVEPIQRLQLPRQEDKLHREHGEDTETGNQGLLREDTE